MRFVLLISLSFFYLGLKAQEVNLFNKYHLDQGDFAITAISINDCVNCYNGYNRVVPFMQTHPELNQVIVLKGISKKDVNYFLTDRFSINRKTTTIITDDSLFDLLANDKAFSSFTVMHNSTILYNNALKYLQPEKLNVINIPQYNLTPFDSTDITDFTGDSERKFKIVTDSTIIFLNQVRFCVELFNINKGKIAKQFPEEGKKGPLLDSIYAKIDFTPQQKKFNREYFSKSGASKTGYNDPEYMLNEIKVNGDKIYVSISITMPVLSIRRNDEGILDSSIGIWRHPMLIILNKELLVTNIINIPLRVPGNERFFNWVSIFYPENDNLFIALSGGNNTDSLLAEYKIDKDSIHFEKILGVKWPPYFPLKGINKINHYNIPAFTNINNLFYYYFSREPVLHTLNNDSPIQLAGWKYSEKDSSDFPNIYVYELFPLRNKIGSIGSFGSSFYLFEYSPTTFFLLQRRNISNRLPFYNDYNNGLLYCSYRRGNHFMLYRYKLT